MNIVKTLWVFEKPLVFLGEERGLTYDADISRDWYNVAQANTDQPAQQTHVKDMYFSNDELLKAIDEEIAYLERKRGEVRKLVYGY